jgi:hypothetical protein
MFGSALANRTTAGYIACLAKIPVASRAAPKIDILRMSRLARLLMASDHIPRELGERPQNGVTIRSRQCHRGYQLLVD